MVKNPKEYLVFDQIFHTRYDYSLGYSEHLVKNSIRDCNDINDLYDTTEIIDESHIHITKAFAVTFLKLHHNRLLFALTAISIIL